MELTSEQYHQFQKNPEKNPITGKKIQIGKKTHQFLVAASERYINSDKLPVPVKPADEAGVVWVVVEENIEPNPALIYQHCIGLYSDLESASDSLIPHVIDNLRYTRFGKEDTKDSRSRSWTRASSSVVRHYIVCIRLDCNSELERWCFDTEKIDDLGLDENSQTEKWKELLISQKL